MKKKVASLLLAFMLTVGGVITTEPAYAAQTSETEALAGTEDEAAAKEAEEAADTYAQEGVEEAETDETLVAAKAHVKASAADVLQPSYTNKKGIQGTEFMDGSSPYTADAGEQQALNINHVLLNIHLNEVINTDGTGTPYTYNGQTYYFNYEGYVKPYEWRVRELREKGQAVTFVLLMDWSDVPILQNLIYPGARVNDGTHYYYALNVDDANARNLLGATFHYLADVFGYSDTFVQNWIIGNEVNVPDEYNYTGTHDYAQNIDICVKSFDLLYDALSDNNPNAKAYISMTNHWTSDNDGIGIPVRDFINAFAEREQGKNWNVAFHAYPANMAEFFGSKKSAERLRHDENSQYVCGANLEVLTDYIKEHYGSSHRVILSEQGFDASGSEEVQAAMLAYTYFAAARNDMIDAAIFLSWEDSSAGQFQGYKFGLKDASGRHRPAYDVFKYMNYSDAGVVSAHTDYYLQVCGISNWTDDVLWKPTATNAVLTGSSLYMPPECQTNELVMIGMTTSTSEPTDLEYRWLIYDISEGVWSIASGWSTNYEWLRWYPKKSGDYLIQGEVRVAGNPSSTMTQCTGVTTHTEIKGKCQMPYTGEGGGYLIGMETYRNNNYSYEMLILDCTLLAEGKDAWTYTTGKCKVDGNAFWTIWQPQYGYYWTLFRVYDSAGNLIDEECYGFQNI